MQWLITKKRKRSTLIYCWPFGLAGTCGALMAHTAGYEIGSLGFCLEVATMLLIAVVAIDFGKERERERWQS